jgi:DNA-binding MarR family transcriptional regulator
MDKKQENKRKLEQLDEIDSLIHSPARLKIMTFLFVVENMDYVYLKRVSDLSWGNLSKHLAKLEAAGYVETEKSFEDKKPKTVIWLSPEGRKAFQNYKDNLKQLFEDIKD